MTVILALIFLFGVVISVSGSASLFCIAAKRKRYTFAALMAFLAITQPLGYLIWGDHRADTYFLGWLMGLTPCLIYGFFLDQPNRR